jgi:hypothetical protein
MDAKSTADDITPLKYRVFRHAAQFAAATLPDEGEHNLTIVRRLALVHDLSAGDVVVFDLGADHNGKNYSIAYEVNGRGSSIAIRLPEYARL